MFNIVDSIGLFAAILTTISFLPQVIKVIKTNDTRALSLSMYVAFVCGVALWLAYGIAKNDMPITLANAITLLFAATILSIKIKNRKADKLATRN
ncbi:SemiSWEET transporter [Glaciecola sp. 2405UD65-10]|jgi:MtN3 and saliva related transmembrane protein|uniref:SemiSWEET transporter n=1 Tax=Glaciecola sp. 2405UD65-10 TaxID=3397244 RepID=UPI003B5B85F4